MVDISNLTEAEQMALKTSGVKPIDHSGSHLGPKDHGMPDYGRLQIPLGMQHEAAIISELSALIAAMMELRRKYGLSSTDYVFELRILIKSANERLRQKARLGRAR